MKKQQKKCVSAIHSLRAFSLDSFLRLILSEKKAPMEKKKTVLFHEDTKHSQEIFKAFVEMKNKFQKKFKSKVELSKSEIMPRNTSTRKKPKIPSISFNSIYLHYPTTSLDKTQA